MSCSGLWGVVASWRRPARPGGAAGAGAPRAPMAPAPAGGHAGGAVGGEVLREGAVRQPVHRPRVCATAVIRVLVTVGRVPEVAGLIVDDDVGSCPVQQVGDRLSPDRFLVYRLGRGRCVLGGLGGPGGGGGGPDHLG